MSKPELTKEQKSIIMSTVDTFAAGRSNYGAVYDTVANMIAEVFTIRCCPYDCSRCHEDCDCPESWSHNG